MKIKKGGKTVCQYEVFITEEIFHFETKHGCLFQI